MHEALFWKERKGADGKQEIVCELCPRRCVMHEGQLGGCGVRKMVNGKLFAMTYGEPCSLHVDPVEKKPLYHFYPGELIFSLATIGCNLYCDFCQNWQISKDRWGEEGVISGAGFDVPPERILELCEKEGCRLIAFTYTEPSVFYEYALDIAKLAKKKGMECVIISNGYIASEATKKWAPYLSAANIDLKGSKDFYRKRCKVPDYEDIRKTIILLKELGIHVEVTNLLIPGENDSEKDIEELAIWLSESVGRDTPLHFSAFHPEYKLLDKKTTPVKTLLWAREIAKRHLDFVYLGNVSGVDNDTRCQECGAVVIERPSSKGKSLLKNGKCPKCGTVVAGRFTKRWADKR